MKDRTFEVVDTTEDFNSWISREFIPEAMRAELLQSQVLIVPEMGFRGSTKPLFPIGTESLFAYLKRSLVSVRVDICINDDDYAELALHSDTARLGRFVVAYLVLPVFLNVLANYIYDKAKGVPKGSDISFSITVVHTNGSSKQISYEGPAQDFTDIAKDIETLWKAK